MELIIALSSILCCLLHLTKRSRTQIYCMPRYCPHQQKNDRYLVQDSDEDLSEASLGFENLEADNGDNYYQDAQQDHQIGTQARSNRTSKSTKKRRSPSQHRTGTKSKRPKSCQISPASTSDSHAAQNTYATPSSMSSDDSSQAQAAENAALKATIALLQGQQKSGRGKKKGDDMADDMKKLVKKTVRDVAWRTVKFVTSDGQKRILAVKVMENLGINDYHPTLFGGEAKDLEENRQRWLHIYEEYCLQELNKCRTYVIGRIRIAMLAYLEDHKGKMPLKGNWLACLTRNCKTEDSKELYVFWVDTLVPLAAGNVHHWNKAKRYYTSLATCKFEGQANKLFVPPSTEAMLMVVMDGYCGVWKEQYVKRKKDGRSVKLVTPRAKKGEKLSEAEQKLRCKYTELDVGQVVFGGWNKEGITAFINYKTLNAEARKTPESSTLDMETMAKIRVKDEVTAATMAEFLAEKKRKKAAEPTENQVVEMDLFADNEE